MADVKIPDLNPAALAAATNLFEMDDGAGGSWRLTAAQIGTLFKSQFSGAGAPTTQIPYGGSGTYWDTTNKILYNWNSNSSTWE